MKCQAKAGVAMEYLYLAMFLQAVGREINEANIKKIFAALDMEVDGVKVQFLIPALSILTAAKENSVTKAKEVVGPEQEAKTDLIQPAEAAYEQPARYVYGVANNGVSDNLGAIGLDGAGVYTIPYKDICVIVHNCLAEPYKSDDQAVVKDWLFTQQEVLDAVVEKYGVVLPMSFDMIIEGKDGNNPEQTVKGWLEENYDDFRKKLARFMNKHEYGVQVILDTEVLGEKLFAADEKLRTKKQEIDSKPEGIAYLERELLKDLLKEKIEEKADQYFREFYNMIKKCTDDIVIGKVKKVGGSKQMLMNLSCLVNKDRVAELGQELEQIEKTAGVSVRFSGPWAAYSFVTPEKGVTNNGDDLSV